MAEDDVFPMNYLEVMATLDTLENALIHIGMSGSMEMRHLRNAVIKHGAETYREAYK